MTVRLIGGVGRLLNEAKETTMSSDRDKTPTPEGLTRYEPDGYYAANGEQLPCTCFPTCSKTCKGECGCAACHAAFQDFGYDE